MLDSIEWKGYFFLPENKEEKLPGILKFDPSEGIAVDLFGSFDSYANIPSNKKNVMLGITSEGKEITLVNCFETERGNSFPGFPSSKFSATYLLAGYHFESYEKIFFSYVNIEYENFNAWVDISGFNKPEYDYNENKLTVVYKQPEKLHFDLNENWKGEVEFVFYRPHEFFIPSEKINIEQTPIFKIRPAADSHFDEFDKVMYIFNSFLAINYYQYPILKSITFYISDKEEFEGKLFDKSVQLYFYTGYNAGKKVRSKRELLIEYKLYANFNESIQKWYKLYNTIEKPVKVLNECLMRRGNPIETHFTSLVNALENMHESILGKKKQSLTQRLTSIIENLPEKVRDALLGHEVDFIDRVKNNRHYYTHYSDKYKKKAATLTELIIISEKLKLILLVSLLKQISFTDEQIEKIIFSKGIYLFLHLLKVK